jgi:DNA-binding cell septation regulator SpoVG
MSQPNGFTVENFKPMSSGALRGFFSVTTPAGMKLHRCSLYEKDGNRWIAGPSRQYEAGGQKKYEPLVEFVDRETRDKFSRAVIVALDAHLEGQG